MGAAEAIVFGIGNPGGRYVATRHNLGFLVVDALAERAGVVPRPLAGLPGEGARGRLEGRSLLLVKPHTCVNRCGPLLAALLDAEGLAPADALVVVDDLWLEPGRLRLRGGGSDGGHNGLKSIAAALGTDAFPRLRVGIGQPPPGVPAERYVLEPCSPEEAPLVAAALDRAALAAGLWLRVGLDAAMAETNRRDLDRDADRA